MSSPPSLILLARRRPARRRATRRRRSKPPLTKEQERERFHPRATGMEPRARLAGYAQRLEMEKASPLQGLRFRSVGPEIQGGRIVDIEAPPRTPGRPRGRLRLRRPLAHGQPRRELDAALRRRVRDHDRRLRARRRRGPRRSTSAPARTTPAAPRTPAPASSRPRTAAGPGRNVGLHGLAPHRARARRPRATRSVVYVAAIGHLYTENAERGVYKQRRRRANLDARAVRRRAHRRHRPRAGPDAGRTSSTRRRGRGRARPRTSWRAARAAGIWKSTRRRARPGRGWPAACPPARRVGRIGLGARPVAAGHPVRRRSTTSRCGPRAEPLDEETPPRRADTAPAARAERRRLRAPRRRGGRPLPPTLRLPEGAQAGTRSSGTSRPGRIAIADLVAYLQDANRDLFENEIVRPEVYRSDDGGATWRRTHEGRIEKVYYSYGYYFGRIAVDPPTPSGVYFARRAAARPRPTAARPGRASTSAACTSTTTRSFIDPRAPNRAGPRQRRRAQPLVRPRRHLDEGQQPARRPVHDPRPRQRRARTTSWAACRTTA